MKCYENKNVYPEIDAAIARVGMNVSAFCTAMEIERTTYYAWQKHGKIPATQLLKMSRLLHRGIDELLGNMDFADVCKSVRTPTQGNAS